MRTPTTHATMPVETKDPGPDAAAVMVEVLKLLQPLEEQDLERVYAAVGAYFGINDGDLRRIADTFEELVEESKR